MWECPVSDDPCLPCCILESLCRGASQEACLQRAKAGEERGERNQHLAPSIEHPALATKKSTEGAFLSQLADDFGYDDRVAEFVPHAASGDDLLLGHRFLRTRVGQCIHIISGVFDNGLRLAIDALDHWLGP